MVRIGAIGPVLICAFFSAGSAFGAENTETEVKKNTFVFYNPCERGPLPKVRIINQRHKSFVREIMQYYPDMKLQNAEFIASQLCEDLTIVGDDAALTERFKFLVAEYGELGDTPRTLAIASTETPVLAEAVEPAPEPEPLSVEPVTLASASDGSTALQLGTFSVLDNAERLVAALNAEGLGGEKVELVSNGRALWRVVANNIATKETLNAAQAVAREFGITDAFVVRK